MSVPPRLAALVLAALLLTACGDDDGSGGSDDSGATGEGPAAESTAPTTTPEPTAVWVGSSETSALLRIDPASRAVQEFGVDEGPWKVEYVDGTLWVRSPEAQRIDPETGQPTDVLFEEVSAHDFLVDGDGVWMSRSDTPKLVRYDLESGQPVDEVTLPSEDLNLEHMTLRDGFMLAANSYDGTAVRIDLGNGAVAGTYDPDEVIWDLQLVGDSLWVAHYSGLVELDAESFEVRRTIQGVDAAYALDVDETGRVWVGLDEMIGTIGESGQLEPVATVSDGTGAGNVDDIEVSESSAWISHEDVGLVRLDRATNQLDEPIPLPGAGTFAPTFDVALQ